MTRRVPADRLPIIDGDVARLPLTRGQVAIIDAVDVALVAGRSWHSLWIPAMDGYYAVRNGSRAPGSIEGRTVLMHRLITSAEAALVVDHINHDTLDNRRANLRLATRMENQRNRLHSYGKHRYVGVSFYEASNRTRPWVAATSVKHRRIYIGYYLTAEEAARARDDYIREHLPSAFWTFNFPRAGERGFTERTSA